MEFRFYLLALSVFVYAAHARTIRTFDDAPRLSPVAHDISPAAHDHACRCLRPSKCPEIPSGTGINNEETWQRMSGCPKGTVICCTPKNPNAPQHAEDNQPYVPQSVDFKLRLCLPFFCPPVPDIIKNDDDFFN